MKEDRAVRCPRCQSTLPEAALYCPACGYALRAQDATRRHSYAVKPDESVSSLRVVSTIMPRGGAGHRPGYAIAFVVTALATVLTSLFAAMPLALFCAAFAIPLIYLIYLHDVNLWNGEPVKVVLQAFGVAFALGLLWTWLWSLLRGAPQAATYPGHGPTFSWQGFLVVVVLAPAVGEALRELGPMLLVHSPKFDVSIDGFAFGVISGVAYSTAETLVVQWPLLSFGFAAGHVNALTMIAVMLLHGFVKPLVYGTATGLAIAEFSGFGEGTCGFTSQWARGGLNALAAIVLYTAGIYLLGLINTRSIGITLCLLWGCLLASILLVAARNLLHAALIDVTQSGSRAPDIAPSQGDQGAAIAPLTKTPDASVNHDEDVRDSAAAPLLAGASAANANHDTSTNRDNDNYICAYCQLPLPPGAAFCPACGASTQVRICAGSRSTQPSSFTQPNPWAQTTAFDQSYPLAQTASPSQTGPPAQITAGSLQRSPGAFIAMLAGGLAVIALLGLLVWAICGRHAPAAVPITPTPTNATSPATPAPAGITGGPAVSSAPKPSSSPQASNPPAVALLPVSVGNVVNLGSNVSAAIPAGWTVMNSKPASVVIGNDTGAVLLQTFKSNTNTPASTVLDGYLQKLAGDLQNAKVTAPQDAGLDTTKGTGAIGALTGTEVTGGQSYVMLYYAMVGVRNSDGESMMALMSCSPDQFELVDDDYRTVAISMLKSLLAGA